MVLNYLANFAVKLLLVPLLALGAALVILLFLFLPNINILKKSR